MWNDILDNNLCSFSDPTFGNEAVQLMPVTVENIHFVDFQTNEMVADHDPWADRIEFWQNLLHQHFTLKENKY